MEEILQGLVAYFAGSPRMIAGQIIGFAPMILSFFVYIFNDRKKTIVLKTIMDVLWALPMCAAIELFLFRDRYFRKKPKK